MKNRGKNDRAGSQAIFPTGPDWKHLQTKKPVWPKCWSFFSKGSKRCWGKKRKCGSPRSSCWLPAFSVFPNNDVFVRVVRLQDCIVKSEPLSCRIEVVHNYTNILQLLSLLDRN